MNGNRVWLLAPCVWLLAAIQSPGILDTNNNGLSDLWEGQFNNQQIFPDTAGYLADDDPDVDGWTNAQEAAAGTDPFQANPPDGFVRPDIEHVPATYFTTPENGTELQTPESFILTWPTIAGKSYTLWFSPDLAAGSWLPLGPSWVAGASSTTSTTIPVTQPDGSTPDKLFWRVTIEDVDADTDGLTDAEEYVLGTNPDKKTSLAGIPDLWLATYFKTTLLNGGLSSINPNADPDGDGSSIGDEALASTNPNVANPPSERKWISVTGDGEQDVPINRTGTLTIPAGQSAILVVATASDEFPKYTGDASQWNDLLQWNVTPSQGNPITGNINVNDRHAAWVADQANGTSIPGFSSPAHIEEIRALTAPSNAPLTVQVSVTATNISDNLRPSHVAVGLLPVEVIEVSPKTKDEEGNDIAGSNKPSTGKPLTPFVELNPVADKIAHRELKVRIGAALKGKTVTWTLESVPGATPATIRGAWTNSTSHPNRFEASTTYGANGFISLSQASSKTSVANDGFTAIRVNVPPIGFNQVRIKILIEGFATPINLIDMEVPSVVVIDPGHGGTTNMPGSSSNNAVSPSGVLEKTMALDYGLALRDSLRAKRQQDKLNLRVFMTREIDENKSGEDRGHKARDNGADVLFVLHFNSDDDSGTTAHPRVPHRSRGTLEVYRTDNNVSPQEDTDLTSDLIDRMVAAMTPFDAGANHRTRVAYGGNGVGGPAVSSDVYNGNTATYHPIRTAYIEGEFIDFGANTAADHTDDAVDILLNTGSNTQTVKTAITGAIRDGILQNLRNQP